MKTFEFHLVYVVVLAVVAVSLGKVEPDFTLSGYVSSKEKLQLKQVFEDAWKLDDIGVLHYALSSYRFLKVEWPVPAKDICDFVKKSISTSNSLEVLYHASAIFKDVPSCSSSQFVKDVGAKVLQFAQKEKIFMEDLFYTVYSLNYLNSNTSDVSFIGKSLKNILKSNDTLLNLGYALHVATILPKTDMESVYSKIDSIIVQTDEVDGRYLQFEGGLTLTALIIDGIYQLSEKLNKAPPLTNVQLIKFVNYFLSRTTVSRPRGVFGLVQVLQTLSDNSFHAFVSVGPLESELSKEKSLISLRVSDILGESLFKTDPSALTVTLVSGSKKTDGTPLSYNKLFTSTSDKTKYTLSSDGLNLFPDFYKFTVSVAHPKGKVGNKVIVNGVHNNIELKVTTKVKVENFQIGVLDTEQSSATSLNKLEYPKKLSEVFNVDAQQRLLLKFTLNDVDFGKLYKVQQSFVKLTNKKTNNEASFVCQSDSNHNFKLSIDLVNAGQPLEYISGDYEVTLVLGDVLISPSIQWPVANVKLKFGQDYVSEKSQEVLNYYLAKPKIEHLFREPEKRPPAIVSNVFTGFVLAPLAILFVLWLKLGVNLKNFPLTLSSLGFHLGLGTIFLLFGVFWWQLNMFQTIKYLLLLGAVTFFSGNRMLSDIASRSKK